MNDSIPRGLFDEVYALPTSPQCRTSGLQKNCAKTCEPGPDNTHGENLILLPGEAEYLKSRFAERGLEWKWESDGPVVVGLSKTCPYHVDRVCTIHDLRPFTCRSYPLRCHRVGKKSLAVFSAMGCPFKVADPDQLMQDWHHRTWVGAWKAVMPYLDDRWWTSFERAAPAGMVHLGDILDPEEEGVPAPMLFSYADPECDVCGGTGMLDEINCLCVNTEALGADMNDPGRRFTS